MTSFTNIAAYQFARLTDLKVWRSRLLDVCRAGDLKGTILLSTEGINLFVAGRAAAIEQLLATLAQLPGLAPLDVKYSTSAEQPFHRMLVKIKREIIAFGVPNIDPVAAPAPRVEPRELKQWLDERRPLVLLDTRNDYEVKLGTFQEAATLPIRHFRDFPTAVASLPPEWKERTVVTFCTGGIRCEKAAPLLQQQGFRDVYQLSGGILKYFEECGPAHYDGTCFVFDQRVGLDATLAETSASYCFACLAPLTDHDRADPRYEPERSCPHCFVPPEVVREKTLAERAALLARITAVLPGSVPADNYRPLRVPARCAGFTVLEFLFNLFPQIAHETWLEIVSRGHITSVARQSVTAEQIVQPGERYYHVTPGQIEPDVNNQVRFIHEDEALIVVAKPAPLPVHPCGRYERNTLTHWLEQVYAPQQPRPVHRLDANTTGLLVLARTRRYASLVQPQFARGEVVKTYLALVHGAPLADHFHCHAPISQSAGPVGARALDPAGLPAHTEFFVRERRTDGTTLLEAIPHTGRTNQIRLHLWSLGHPIVGDQLFLPDLCTGTTQTASLLDSPLCLHAWKLKLCHPITGETVLFQCQSPSW